MISYSGMESVNEIFSFDWLIISLLLSLTSTIVLTLLARKFFQIMQQSGYQQAGYYKWLGRRDNIYIIRLIMVVMLSLLSYLIFSIALAFIDDGWVSYAAFIFYILFVAQYLKADYKRRRKARMVFTARMIRLVITFSIVSFLLSFLLIIGINALGFVFSKNAVFVHVRLCVICVIPAFLPYILSLSALLIKPLERAINRKYVVKTINKLESMSELIKIGITGSYGKTSIKEILKAILDEKYKVLSTPGSYNTPMGICKSVKRLDSTYDVFIAEMGARREGDIREVAEIVKPNYAIINGICEQHLETFQSLKQIVRTKFELIRSMNGGIAILSADNQNTLGLKKDCVKVDAITAGIEIENAPDVYAEDIVLSNSGSSFTLSLFGQKVKATTVLLGKHNISNICLAAALASKIGLSPNEIAAGISRIKPVKHRLELVDNDKNITIIDDSYNSNVVGTIAALEVLSSFNGRKIVLTPGMVELGRIEDYENFAFGKRLAKNVDIAILIGSSGAYRIKDGLQSEDFPSDKIIMAKDLQSASEKLSAILQKGDVVLYENDLPDKFL